MTSLSSPSESSKFPGGGALEEAVGAALGNIPQVGHLCLRFPVQAKWRVLGTLLPKRPLLSTVPRGAPHPWTVLSLLICVEQCIQNRGT